MIRQILTKLSCFGLVCLAGLIYSYVTPLRMKWSKAAVR